MILKTFDQVKPFESVINKPFFFDIIYGRERAAWSPFLPCPAQNPIGTEPFLPGPIRTVRGASQK
jgi:hypothetical protein